MCTRYAFMDDLWFLEEDDFTDDGQGTLFLTDDKTGEFIYTIENELSIDQWRSKPVFSLNIAPTNKGVVIINENGIRIADNYRFGFKRQWMSQGRKKFNPGTNFRFDNLLPNIPEFTDKKLPTNRKSSGNWMYWEAFKNKQFCLIPVRAFVEFDKVEREVQLKTKKSIKKESVPYLTELRSERIALVAGLWEYKDDEYRFTFGTTEPNDLVRKFHHDRFPVFLLSKEQQQLWLDPDASIEDKIRMGLKPAPSELFQSWQVNSAMNKAANKGLDVIKRIEGSLIQIA